MHAPEDGTEIQSINTVDHPYDGLSTKELAQRCKQGGLKASGKAPELIKRLRERDERR
ncbi:MAG: hypothetical protein Q9174_006482, partial [Haloplaca sp. 1 TL-2023]